MRAETASPKSREQKPDPTKVVFGEIFDALTEERLSVYSWYQRSVLKRKKRSVINVPKPAGLDKDLDYEPFHILKAATVYSAKDTDPRKILLATALGEVQKDEEHRGFIVVGGIHLPRVHPRLGVDSWYRDARSLQTLLTQPFESVIFRIDVPVEGETVDVFTGKMRAPTLRLNQEDLLATRTRESAIEKIKDVLRGQAHETFGSNMPEGFLVKLKSK